VSKPEKLVDAFLFAVAFYPVLIGSMYLYLRAVHSPLSPYQRHLLRYQMILFAPTPLFGVGIVAAGIYVTSAQVSLTIGATIFVIWAIISKKLNGARPARVEEN